MKKITGDGDCYVVALEFTMDLPEDDTAYRVCHGHPLGQGKIEGVRYGHAWIEYTEVMEFPNYPPTVVTWVIDRSNGNDVRLPAAYYYRLGNIDPAEVTRYTVAEAHRLAVIHEHYGPWE
jgi:hypothetical protein